MTRSGAGKTQLPTCQYFKELQFITDTVTNLPTISNVPTSDPALFTPPPSPALPPPSPAISDTYDNNDNPTPPSNATPVAKKRRRDISSSGSDMNQLLMQSIQRDLNTPTQPAKQDEKDSDTLFCLSLVQDFKDLPARKKRLARVKIMQVISDLHGDDVDY